MYRSRQNILNKQLNTKNNNFYDEYGMGRQERKFRHKEPMKSRSHKDILISRNKKLPEFFKIQTKNSSNHFPTQSQKFNQLKHHSKFTLMSNKKQQYPAKIKTNDQYCFQNQKTCYFVCQIQQKKQIQRRLQQNTNTFFKGTQQSYRTEAKQIKQKLKKSSSMNNLIQQRFLLVTQQKNSNQKALNNIQTGRNYQTMKQYDSKKYDWRLSRSKERQKSRGKSLSGLQSKAKFLCELNKGTGNKNKLSLGVGKEILRKKSAQLSHACNIKEQNKQIQKGHEQSSERQQDRLTYTFGSNDVKSLYFS